MEAVAKTKYLKGSPRKTRLVIDMIRGVNVSRALSILKFTDKRAAQPIAQCLSSAIANATFKAEQQNIAIDPDDLWVKTCFVDMGPHKNRSRMRPAPQGRAYREQRHYCHITIEVTSADKPKTEKELKAEAAKAKKAATGGKVKGKSQTAKPAAKKEAKKADEAKPVEEIIENKPVETFETPDVKAEIESAKADAEVADAKNVETQTTASLNETKRADEKQQDINEELERQ
ncbi:MAG: 50S ribosomal protein L22 [Pyrinomonadaceae bacterium]